jgi:hypothetical protein
MDMHLLRILALPALLVVTGAAHAADPWTANRSYLKSAIAECRAANRDRTGCRHFTGEALRRLFGIGDFCTPNRCLKAVEIEWELRNHPEKWMALGVATDQAVLNKARDLATKGKAVIAVKVSRDRGQVAIIMPGPAAHSASWGRDVPLSVAARVDRPHRSIYRKGISWLFAEPEQVRLYVRR